jgi:hypothetical protein
MGAQAKVIPVIDSRNSRHEMRLDDLSVFKQFEGISGCKGDCTIAVDYENLQESLVTTD